MCFLGYSAHHKGYRRLDLSSNRVIISRHVIFDETAFPFAEHHGPSTPVDLEFLADDTTDVVPTPIVPLHKFLPAGTPPSASDTTSAPAGPSMAVPGAPLELPEDADDPPTPALYIPPALRASRTPTAPRAALRSPTSAPRTATELIGAHNNASPHLPYVLPALRAGSPSSAPSTGSPAPPQAPRGPPPGFSTSSPGSRLHIPLLASTATTTGCSCTGRPDCSCTSRPAAQGCGSCSTGGQPALHGHPFEERLPDARRLPCCASLSGAKDRPKRSY